MMQNHAKEYWRIIWRCYRTIRHGRKGRDLTGLTSTHDETMKRLFSPVYAPTRRGKTFSLNMQIALNRSQGISCVVLKPDKAKMAAQLRRNEIERDSWIKRQLEMGIRDEMIESSKPENQELWYKLTSRIRPDNL